MEIFKKIGLNNNQLKVIAMLSMLIDHIGGATVPCLLRSKDYRADCFPDLCVYDCGRLLLHQKSREVFGFDRCPGGGLSTGVLLCDGVAVPKHTHHVYPLDFGDFCG